MFSSVVSNGLYGAITTWIYKPKQKDILIDPMSCLIKLAVLSHLPDGTKMSIINNKILFIEPNILQGAIRFFQSDNREDLHNLFNPIQKGIKWYWNNEDEGIKYLFKLATNGLYVLKKSYPLHSTIQHTLDYYIKLLDSKELVDEKLEEDVSTQESEINTTKSIYTFLKGLWNKREINIIIELLKEYKLKRDDVQKELNESLTLLNTINAMTDIKDKKLNIFLLEHTTIL
jgi:hypothetical protein